MLRQLIIASDTTGANLVQDQYYAVILATREALVAQLAHFYHVRTHTCSGGMGWCVGRCSAVTRVVVTVELCCLVLRQLVIASDTTGANLVQDQYYAVILATREALVAQLAHFYHTDELFLDHFEDEYEEFQRHQLKIHLISSDPVLLLSPSNTPMGGVEFDKRLPCGPQEHARRAVRVYFILRQFILDLEGKSETKLPLASPKDCVIVNDCLNLNNSDLLSCTVSLKNGVKLQRFLVTDGLQLILVEPDQKRLGWGIVRFVGFLQDVDITGDKDDSRALMVTIHQSTSKGKSTVPVLQARFIFDDHIRCMAAKQRLTKGKQKARRYKLDLIADLLEISAPSPPAQSVSGASGGSPSSHFRSLPPMKGKVPGYPSLSTTQRNVRTDVKRTKKKRDNADGIQLQAMPPRQDVEISVVDDPSKVPEDPSNAAADNGSLKRPPIHDV